MTEAEVLNEETSSYKTNEREAEAIEQEVMASLAIIIVIAEQFLTIYGANALNKPMSVNKKKNILMSIPGMTVKEALMLSRAHRKPIELIKYIADVQFMNLKQNATERIYERLMNVAIKNVKSKGRYLRGIGYSRGDKRVERTMLNEILLKPHLGQNEKGRNFVDLLDVRIGEVEELFYKTLGEYTQSPGNRLIFRFQAEPISDKVGRHMRNILRNETSRIIGETNALIYEQFGIEYYVYVAVLDDRTTSTCLSLDGQVFKLSERSVGVNASPMHFNCRSTELPAI